MKLEFSQQRLEKSWNIKFHENPSSGSWVVPCGRTDMTKPIAAFRNFQNAPKTWGFLYGVSEVVAHMRRRHMLVVDFRRFGPPYRSDLQETSSARKFHTWRWNILRGGGGPRLTTCLARTHTALFRTEHSRHIANVSLFSTVSQYGTPFMWHLNHTIPQNGRVDIITNPNLNAAFVQSSTRACLNVISQTCRVSSL